MSTLTEKLKLFKYNTETDGKKTFKINESLNDNWDKIEENFLAVKYNEETVYNDTDWVWAIVDGKKRLFQSKQDENLGHVVTDNEWWEEGNLSSGSGTSLPLFTPVVQTRLLPFEESMGLALQGTYVYKTGVAGERYGYTEFVNKCIEEKAAGTATETTLGDNTITLYTNSSGNQYYDIADKAAVDEFYNSTGIAYFYGIDEENERIFLPRNDYFFMTNGQVGYIPPALPNWKATISPVANKWTGSTVPEYITSGGVKRTEVGTAVSYTGGQAPLGGSKYAFSLSDYNSIYQDGVNTVQPPAQGAYLYIVVGNTSEITNVSTTITDSEVLSQINKNTSDILNITDLPHIIDTYINGTSGYIVYSNGYCVQWGRVTGLDVDITITFLKSFKDINYNITQSELGTDGADAYVNGYRFTNLKTTSMVCSMRNNASKTCLWRAAGYLAEGEY